MIFSFTLFVMLIMTAFSFIISSPFLMNITSIMLMLTMSILLNFLSYIWISYAIFIAFLGGMMVLFSYTTSMVKSEKAIKLKMNWNLIFFLGLFLIISVSISQFGLQTQITKIFLHKYNMAIVFLSLYIILSMIINIKISEIKKGTLKYI